jgi:hypothetical protein
LINGIQVFESESDATAGLKALVRTYDFQSKAVRVMAAVVWSFSTAVPGGAT